MTKGLILAAVAMSLIVAMRYVLSSGFFAWLTTKRKPKHHTGLQTQIQREIKWSLASAVIYGVPAGLTFWTWRHLGWTQMYIDTLDYPIWYVPISIMMYLVAHDTWFYWTHRAMHSKQLFNLAHSVHHQSKPPTAWAAMSFHPFEAVVGAIFIPIMAFLVPIHLGALAIVLTVMTIMGVTNHMGWEIFPKWFIHSALGKWLITASHHERHHEQYKGNYGLYFRFWDKICGTDHGLSNNL